MLLYVWLHCYNFLNATAGGGLLHVFQFMLSIACRSDQLPAAGEGRRVRQRAGTRGRRAQSRLQCVATRGLCADLQASGMCALQCFVKADACVCVCLCVLMRCLLRAHTCINYRMIMNASMLVRVSAAFVHEHFFLISYITSNGRWYMREPS